jgi:hypothetical protein
MSARPTAARLAQLLAGGPDRLVRAAEARLGHRVQAATSLTASGGLLAGVLGPRRARYVLVITDEHVYLLDRRTPLIGPALGGVIAHYPLAGTVATWRRRPLTIAAELSWPDEHAFIAGRMPLGAHTDRILGLLTASEFAHLVDREHP